MDRPYGRTEVQAGVLGARVVIWRRAIGCAPAERIAADKQAMLSLPPVAPATGWRASLRLPRDYYLRYDTNDYSASPAVIGRRIEVVAGRADSLPGRSADAERACGAPLTPQTSASPAEGQAKGQRPEARAAKPRQLHADLEEAVAAAFDGAPPAM